MGPTTQAPTTTTMVRRIMRAASPCSWTYVDFIQQAGFRPFGSRGAGREDRTLLRLLVGQVFSPENEPRMGGQRGRIRAFGGGRSINLRSSAPRADAEPPDVLRLKVGDPDLWKTGA